ncbi:MAG: acyltransferase [Bacteroidales bacterium]|nr:acyltransferase [Bacteroidales bacterium]
MIDNYLVQLFKIKTQDDFKILALEAFNLQYKYNKLYSQYVDYIKVKPSTVKNLTDIPFLPIQFFKSHKILTEFKSLLKKQFVVFHSSGTTQIIKSKHYVYDTEIYEKSFIKTFKQLIGKPHEYVILALLPSYIQAGNSSLVYMVDKLISLSKNSSSGFFLKNYDKLLYVLKELKKQNKKVILFGVTYALLEFSEILDEKFPNIKIIETGGMKGRGEELTRTQLHNELKNKFGTQQIFSEYGMTELLSQAYSLSDEFFIPAKTMKILIRDINDPFSYLSTGNTGGINIIDLCNIYSCCFIETKDLGNKAKNKFQVIGRFDNSDVRGCNLITY